MTALFSLDTVKDVKIAVIGLGYVGLPLAIAFAAKYRVLGFDIDTARISELHLGRCLGGKTGVRFRHPK